jgi:hypothetical protein
VSDTGSVRIAAGRNRSGIARQTTARTTRRTTALPTTTGIGAAGEEATDEHADRRRPGTTWPPDPPPDQITDAALAQMRLYPALLVLPAAGVASVAPARARVLATAPADAGGGPRLGTATGNDPSAQAVHVPVFSRDLVNQLPRWGEGNGWHYPGSHLLYARVVEQHMTNAVDKFVQAPTNSGRASWVRSAARGSWRSVSCRVPVGRCDRLGGEPTGQVWCVAGLARPSSQHVGCRVRASPASLPIAGGLRPRACASCTCAVFGSSCVKRIDTRHEHGENAAH